MNFKMIGLSDAEIYLTDVQKLCYLLWHSYAVVSYHYSESKVIQYFKSHFSREITKLYYQIQQKIF